MGLVGWCGSGLVGLSEWCVPGSGGRVVGGGGDSGSGHLV